ncbi:MAG: DUF4412 domain-containing protein [Gemmatimonas sp.]
MIRAIRTTPARVAAIALVALSACALPAAAQRFEGIITMKLNAAGVASAVGGRGARGDAGRGGPPAGPGGTVPGRGGRGQAGRGEAAGSAPQGASRPTDAQAEAMRAAFAGGIQQLEYMTRRGRVRVAILGANGGQSPAAMIYAPDEGVMYTLLPPVSMYSETPMADLQGLTANPETAPLKPPVVTHTKQFELVAGHRCEHVTVAQGTIKTDVCMGKGLGVFIMPAGFGRSAGWDRAIADLNGFPLKVVQGGGTVIMEVTKIERKALSESLFSVPANFTLAPDFMRRPTG